MANQQEQASSQGYYPTMTSKQVASDVVPKRIRVNKKGERILTKSEKAAINYDRIEKSMKAIRMR